MKPILRIIKDMSECCYGMFCFIFYLQRDDETKGIKSPVCLGYQASSGISVPF